VTLFRLVALVALATLAAHGLALANDGIFWDDWLYWTQLREGHPDLVVAAYRDAGWPLGATVHLLLWTSPDPVTTYRVVGIVAIATCGALVALLLRELDLADVWGSSLAGIALVVSPAFEVVVSMVMVPILVFLVAFLAGMILVVRSIRREDRTPALVRACGLVLLVIGFSYRPLSAAYAGLGIVALVTLPQLRALGIRRALLQHLDLVALVPVYWLADLVLFPQRGAYANEYAFAPALQAIGASVASLRVLLLDLPLRSLIAFGLMPLATVPLALLAGVVTHRTIRPAGHGASWPLLVAGLVLLACALLPLGSTGRAAAAQGWSLRHLLVASLAASMIFVAVVRGLSGRGPLGRAAAVGLIALMLSGSVALGVRDQLGWLARWSKDQAVVARISMLDPVRAASVVWFDDRDPLGGEPVYRFYERTGMLRAALGVGGRIGVDRGPYGVPVLSSAADLGAAYLIEGVDVGGCRAEVVIRAASDLGEADIGVRYLIARWSGGSAVSDLESSVVSLEARALPDAGATHCPRSTSSP
jgi:hypothetical protein